MILLNSLIDRIDCIIYLYYIIFLLYYFILLSHFLSISFNAQLPIFLR